MVVFVSLFANFIVNIASKVATGIITLILLARLIRDYVVLQDVIQLFSQDIRRIFNRSRSRQKEKNLDITYISCDSSSLNSFIARVLAMSWPGSAWESVWRNSIIDVEEFLNKRHMGHYWVYDQ